MSRFRIYFIRTEEDWEDVEAENEATARDIWYRDLCYQGELQEIVKQEIKEKE